LISILVIPCPKFKIEKFTPLIRDPQHKPDILIRLIHIWGYIKVIDSYATKDFKRVFPFTLLFLFFGFFLNGFFLNGFFLNGFFLNGFFLKGVVPAFRVSVGDNNLGVLLIHAQEKKEGNKVGGIRAGYHSAALADYGSEPDTANSLNSFYVGFYRDTKIIPLLHFGTGMEYFQNGMKYSTNNKRVLHTVSVPLDLKLKLGPVFALGGFAANFKVSEKVVIEDNVSNPIESDKSEWFDIPFFLGAGVKIFFVTIEARYHWGLLDVRDGKHSQYLQIGAGISF